MVVVVVLAMTAFLTWTVVDTRSVVVTLFAVFVLFVQSVDRVVGVAVIVIIVNDTQARMAVVRTIAVVVMPMVVMPMVVMPMVMVTVVMVTVVMVVVLVPVVVVARPGVVVMVMAMVPPYPSCPPLQLGSVTSTVRAELREKLSATVFLNKIMFSVSYGASYSYAPQVRHGCISQCTYTSRATLKRSTYT